MKRPPQNTEGVFILVRPNGFEPSAPSVGGSCSIQLSYGRIFNLLTCRTERKHVRASVRRRFVLYLTELRRRNAF